MNDTRIHEALVASPSQPPSIAQDSSDALVALEAVEALRWCEEHDARVIWQRADPERPRCTVEVLAPGSNWNLLRGRGADFFTAYRAARSLWATPRSRAA